MRVLNVKTPIIILVAILLSITMPAEASDILLCLSRGKSSKSLTATFTNPIPDGKASWFGSITQNSKGLFSLKPSTYISASRKTTINQTHVTAGTGEIRFDTSGLRTITNPSKTPTYAGFWFKTTTFDAAVFSPLIHPQSPTGFITFIKSPNLTVGTGVIKNSKYSTSSPQSWQLDYKDLKTPGIQAQTSINTGNGANRIEIKAVFSQLNEKSISQKLTYSQGGFTYRMKADPEIERTIMYSTEDFPWKFTVAYSETLGQQPVYGGTSQEAQFTLSSELSFYSLAFRTTSIAKYNRETGTESLTKFSVILEGAFYNGHIIQASVTPVLRRTQGSDLCFVLPEMYFKTQGVSFSYKNNKGVLEFSKSFKIKKTGLVVCFNQNRLLTLYTTLKL